MKSRDRKSAAFDAVYAAIKHGATPDEAAEEGKRVLAGKITKRQEEALQALYRAAFDFAFDRQHFAPGQYTMFIPKKGTDHYTEHEALVNAALAYAETVRPRGGEDDL